MAGAGESPRAELRRLIEEDGPFTSALYALAMRRAYGNVAAAEDLFQNAILKMLDPARKEWNPEEQTAFVYAAKVINGLAQNERRRAYNRRRADFDESRPPPVTAEGADPAALLTFWGSQKRIEELEKDLLVYLADDPLALDMLVWLEQGIDGNQDLAKQLETDVPTVRACKERLRNAAKAVVNDRPSAPWRNR
jgi:DNA-directed RNA polymerase specialized sigma24 family protein